MLEATMARRSNTRRQRLYTLREIADEANVDIETVYRHVKKGALRVVHVGPFRRLRVTAEARREYVGFDDI